MLGTNNSGTSRSAITRSTLPQSGMTTPTPAPGPFPQRPTKASKLTRQGGVKPVINRFLSRVLPRLPRLPSRSPFDGFLIPKPVRARPRGGPGRQGREHPQGLRLRLAATLNMGRCRRALALPDTPQIEALYSAHPASSQLDVVDAGLKRLKAAGLGRRIH